MNKPKKAPRTGKDVATARQLYITSESLLTLKVLAQRSGLSLGTLVKHCQRDNWQSQREQFWYEVEQRVREKAVAERASRVEANLKLVEAAKRVWFTHLAGKMKVRCEHCGKEHEVPMPTFRPAFGDISQLLRLEELLLGQPDSRMGLTAENRTALDSIPEAKLIEAMKGPEDE